MNVSNSSPAFAEASLPVPLSRPRVSLCMPTLNSRRFLDERLSSIRLQTLAEWELIAVDSGSNDGTWEVLRELADRDPRIKIAQAPRDGVYPSLNRCIARATGDFVYIAMSDDTMAPDCLEKLVRALDAQADCDLAHCPLRVIGEHGQVLPNPQAWWAERSYFARSSGEFRDRPHVRRAPFDGMLLLGGETVFISLTQLLVRRTLFDRIGLFESRWGSGGDFNWDMRAGLVSNVVHVPDTWGSWRVHPHQATAQVGLRSPEYRRQVGEMIEHALQTTAPYLSPRIRQLMSDEWIAEAAELRSFVAEHRDRASGFARKAFIFQRLLRGSHAARVYLRTRLMPARQRSNWIVETIRGWLRDAGAAEPVCAICVRD